MPADFAQAAASCLCQNGTRVVAVGNETNPTVKSVERECVHCACLRRHWCDWSHSSVTVRLALVQRLWSKAAHVPRPPTPLPRVRCWLCSRWPPGCPGLLRQHDLVPGGVAARLPACLPACLPASCLPACMPACLPAGRPGCFDAQLAAARLPACPPAFPAASLARCAAQPAAPPGDLCVSTRPPSPRCPCRRRPLWPPATSTCPPPPAPPSAPPAWRHSTSAASTRP